VKSVKPPFPAALMLLIVLVLSCPASAEPPAGSANPFSLELGVRYRHFDYREDIDLPRKSTDSGALPGVYLNAAFRKPSIFYTKIHVDYAAADIDFDGTTQSGRPVSFSDQRTKLFKFEWNVGYPIPIGKSFTLIPYVGYGYHYWQRGTSRYISQAGAYAIKEEYTWHYVPVGVTAHYDIADRLTVGLTVSANFMFDGKLKSYASEIDSGLSDFDLALGDKVGCYAELPVTFRFAGNWALVLTPWYEYSAFGQSDRTNITYAGTVIGSTYEPGSRTHQYGADLGVGYSF
jgi:hypothetical protein